MHELAAGVWRSGCHPESPVASLHKSQQPQQSTAPTLPLPQGLSLSWPEACSSSFDAARLFLSLIARAGSVWVRYESCKERRKKTHRLLLHVLLLGQQWLCNLDLKVEKSMNVLMISWAIKSLVLWDCSPSKTQNYLGFGDLPKDISFAECLHSLGFFSFFMTLTLKWIVQSSTCGSGKRTP